MSETNVQASIELVAGGTAKRIVTNISLDEIDAVGVRWCAAFANLHDTDIYDYLGTLLNIAVVCRQHERPIHELGALHLAQRLTKFGVDGVNARVAEIGNQPSFASEMIPKDFRVVCFDGNEAEFTAGIDDPASSLDCFCPGTPLDGVLGPARMPFYDRNFHNVSFHIFKGERRMATVTCLVVEARGLTWTGMNDVDDPIRIHYASDCDQRRQVALCALECLDVLARAYGAKSFMIQEPSNDAMTLYRLLGVRRPMTAELYDAPMVDLTLDEDVIAGDIRKSYRSHINWGKSSLSMEYLSGEDALRISPAALYEMMNHVHEKVIARSGNSLSPAMFQLFVDKVVRNEGEIAIARSRDGALSAMTLSTYAGETAFYALGGSIAADNKNPGCFAVYDALLRAKRRGLRTYQLNRLLSATMSVDAPITKIRKDSLNRLNVFKRGFSSTFDLAYVYKVFPEQMGRFVTF